MDQQVRPGTPFRAFILMTLAISALMTSMRGASLQQAISALGPYEGRGKGRGVYSGRKQANKQGYYTPHQGEREKARRRAQMAKGMLQCSV